VAKPPGSFRIACLGDSYTYGHGVDDSETWPLLLQSRLAGATNDQGIEVLNFGVRAYETEQEVHQLETRVLDFDPDLVLLCWFFNDNAVGPSAEAVDMEAAPGIVRLIGRPNRGFIQTLRENSQLVDLAVVNLYIPVFYDFMSASRSDLYGDHHPGWRRAKQALRHARDLTRERGLPFGVILYPTLYRDGDVLTSHDAYEMVKAVCADLDVPVLDLEPVFLPHDMPRLHVHAYNSHPNGMANRLTADAVAAWLTERGWLPDVD
jgi:lysophospholipase L1-like esterase